MRFEPVVKRAKCGGQLAGFLIWLLMVVASWLLVPNPQGFGTHQQLGLPPCLSEMISHRPCPACGMTTSFAHLMDGDISAAFRDNLFGPVLFVVFSVLAIAGIFGWVFKKRLDCSSAAFNKLALAFLFIYLTYGALRFLGIAFDHGNYGPRTRPARSAGTQSTNL